MVRALCIAAVGLLAAVAPGGCGSSEPASTDAVITTTIAKRVATYGRVAPATFAALPHGWHAFDDDAAQVTTRGAVAASYATSWNYTPSAHGPAGNLPDDGTIINVLLLRRARGRHADATLCTGIQPTRNYPPIGRHPLRLAAMTRGQLEGDPHATEYRSQASRGTDYRIDVRVDLAPRADRRAADLVLAGLRLPRWGRRC